MKIIVIILIFAFGKECFAQSAYTNKNTIDGKVFDDKGRPLHLALVATDYNLNAVYTNEDGAFRLHTDASIDTTFLLSISYVGFETYRQRIDSSNYDQFFLVKLNETQVTLPQATVSTSRSISKANFSIDKNKSKFSLGKVFFNATYIEVNYIDTNINNVVEADVIIEDKSFNKSYQNQKVYIKSLSRTKFFDASCIDSLNLYHNEIASVLDKDFIRLYSEKNVSIDRPYLNEEVEDKFIIRKIRSWNNDSVIQYKLYPKEGLDFFDYSYVVTVNASDNAVIDFDVRKIINVDFEKKMPSHMSYYILKDGSFSERIRIKYRKFNGKYALSHIRVDETYDDECSIIHKKKYSRYREIFVNDININLPKLKNEKIFYLPWDMSIRKVEDFGVIDTFGVNRIINNFKDVSLPNE